MSFTGYNNGTTSLILIDFPLGVELPIIGGDKNFAEYNAKTDFAEIT